MTSPRATSNILSDAAWQLAQMAAAGLGGLAFHLLGVPAAWLSGAVFGAVLWGLAGFARPLPRPLVDAAMLISGVIMGAGVTPEALAALGRYPLSLVLLTLGIVAITAASGAWLTRVSGWRSDDAMLASVPGALTTVLIVAADRGADVAGIAVVQAFRLLVLIAVLPSVIVMVGGGDATALLGQGQPVASPLSLGAVLLAGLAVGLAFERFGLAAPILLGATAASAFAHGTGWEKGVAPPVIATAGLVLIGVFIADRFRTLEGPALRRMLPAALGSFVVGGAVAALFAAGTAALVGIAFADALVAFAPGGLEAMMVLALVLGLDPLYVGTHHLVRFLGIGFALPLVVSWMNRPRR